jgi:hypothetical protein
LPLADVNGILYCRILWIYKSAIFTALFTSCFHMPLHNSARVCNRAPTVCNLFVNISDMSCASILVFDLTSPEAISTILLDVRTEYWYEKIDITNTTATTLASIIILDLSVCHLFKGKHLLYSSIQSHTY